MPNLRASGLRCGKEKSIRLTYRKDYRTWRRDLLEVLDYIFPHWQELMGSLAEMYTMDTYLIQIIALDCDISMQVIIKF